MNYLSGTPSPWVVQHARGIAPGGRVLDLACGSGRHAVWFAQQGYQVEAVDRDEPALSGMAGMPNIQLKAADLETGIWPYEGQRFDGIVVSRYLHRPLLPRLAESLKPRGLLIYETFMVGNERYGKPSNHDFLLQPDELMTTFSPLLTVLAFEQGEELAPKPAVMQRICAIYNPNVTTSGKMEWL
jgi:SAM-dependent methyltransferase